VLDTGAELAFRFLVHSNLESGSCIPSGSPVRSCSGDRYRISAEFETPCEDEYAMRTVRVRAEPHSGWRCLFCLPFIVSVLGSGPESSYPVEVDCHSVDDLLCS
jgi:hypothetical protein